MVMVMRPWESICTEHWTGLAMDAANFMNSLGVSCFFDIGAFLFRSCGVDERRALRLSDGSGEVHEKAPGWGSFDFVVLVLVCAFE
jgi:hypothetical protein